MSTPGVTSYDGSISRTYASSSSGSTTSTKKKSSLDMSDFLKLMAAQYQSQSIDSSVDNTEYITQMAMFSAVEAMNQLTANSNNQYAASLVGKTATVTENNKTVSGVVTGATYSADGSSQVIIGGNSYDIADVTKTTDDSTEMQLASREYAASLIGRTVSVSTGDTSNPTVTGTVSSTVYGTDGSCKILINGTQYDPTAVTAITG